MTKEEVADKLNELLEEYPKARVDGVFLALADIYETGRAGCSVFDCNFGPINMLKMVLHSIKKEYGAVELIKILQKELSFTFTKQEAMEAAKLAGVHIVELSRPGKEGDLELPPQMPTIN